MIEGTENNFGDRPKIYEIEQIAWNGGKGEKCILLIEAYSVMEALKLSGGEDGVHETIAIIEKGSVCLRSENLWNKFKESFQEETFEGIAIVKEDTFRSSNQVNVSDDMVRIVADMPIHTLNKLKKYLKK